MESADVDILTAALTDGLPAVEAACAEAFANGVHFADVVLNTRPPATILTPAALTLRHAPMCALTSAPFVTSHQADPRL
jgi:hypothetical protein